MIVILDFEFIFTSQSTSNKPSQMKEIFIIYLWENRLLCSELRTTDGKTIEVLHCGTLNHNAGPDFLNARIRINEMVWAGNVEMHVNASDWYKHGHNADKSYDTVVLHVVYESDKDTFTTQGKPIPTLSLKGCFDESLLLRYRDFLDSKQWIACQNSVGAIQRFTWLSWLDRLIVERLENKVAEVLQLFEKTGNDWEETFYRRLTSGFGFKVNDMAFAQLAQKLPFNLLLRHADNLLQLEALLFGMAGMLSGSFIDAYPQQLQREFNFLKQKYGLTPMNIEQWRWMRMRPANFPSLRLSQLAALIHQNQRMFSSFLEVPSVENILPKLQVFASPYWDTHFQFDKLSEGSRKNLGKDAIHLLIINVIVQVFFTYGVFHNNETIKDRAFMLLESMDAENNHIIQQFEKLGVVANDALQSQALLQLKKEYCDPKRCLECRIGQLLIKSDAVRAKDSF